MSITLTTSNGDVFSPVKELQFHQAMERLAPLATKGSAFVHMMDDAGNEMTLTARGTLRVYLADSPGHCYALRQGLGHGIELCRRFWLGDIAWFESQAWERDLPLEEGEAPVHVPLPGVAQGKLPPPLPGVGESAVEAGMAPAEGLAEDSPVVCPRCQVRMKQGYLVTYGYRANHPVAWVAKESDTSSGVALFGEPRELRPVIAVRCTSCGHLEFRA